jgi:sugar lactone lactonase YvrE
LFRTVDPIASSGSNGTLRDNGLLASSAYVYLVRADSVGISSRLGAQAMATTLASTGEYACISRYAGIGIPANTQGELPPLMTGLYLPVDVSFGPDGTPYIVDWNNHRIVGIENAVGKTIMAGGEDIGDGSGNDPADVYLNHPTNISFDGQGRLVISAWHNSKVLRLDRPANFVETISGDGSRGVFAGDGGPAIDAKLDLPVATAVDGAGNIYILDSANQTVRKIDAQTDVITTVVGQGRMAGYAGDGGPGTLAKLNLPTGQAGDPAGRMVFGPNGRLYIADSVNERIREWDPVADIITTVAGNGVKGNMGDGGPATAANLNRPSDVAVDADGNIYIADTYNHAIRKVDTNGTITTFAGQLGSSGSTGDGGSPTQAKLNRPYGVDLDADGNIYIADTMNSVIRVVRK